MRWRRSGSTRSATNSDSAIIAIVRRSSSEVPVDIKTLTAGGLAINVHKSADDIKTYVACGNIGKKGGEAKKSSAAKKAEKS